MFGFLLAALINLAPGMNNIGQSGEVVAVNAATAEAAATVNLQKVSTFTTYSNIVDDVVSYDTAYKVNYYGDGVVYSLPDDCFPITYTSDGVAHTVANNSECTYVTQGDDGLLLYHNDVELAYFETNVWNSYSVEISDLLFGGVAPVADQSPVLTQGPQIVTTNVVGYVDWDAFKDTNGVQRIVGDPVRFDLATTNEVVTGQAIANVYTQTNGFATITVEDHFGQVIPQGKLVLMGEAIVVTGAGEGDRINILTK